MMRALLTGVALLATASSLLAACHATYPDSLADCTTVTVTPANPGETGCSVAFEGCPENGSGQMVCNATQCTCTWASDYARDTSSSIATKQCTSSEAEIKTSIVAFCGEPK